MTGIRDSERKQETERELEIILDLPFGFPINNIISLSERAGE